VCADLAADGSWLVAGTSRGAVRIFSADGTKRAKVSVIAEVGSIAISPDGTWFAVGDHSQVHLWTAAGTGHRVLIGHEGRVVGLAISPDGRWLASASWDETVRLWTADGVERVVLKGHRNCVTSVAISPDGRWLATGSWDQTVRTWGVDGTPWSELRGHTDWVHAVRAGRGHVASLGGDNMVRTWEMIPGPRGERPYLPGSLESVAVNSDTTEVLAVDIARRVWIHRSNRGAEEFEHRNYLGVMAITASAGGVAYANFDDRVVLVARGAAPRSPPPLEDVYALALNAAATTLVALTTDGRVCRWTPGQRRWKRLVEGVTAPDSLVLSPSGQLVAVLGEVVRVFTIGGALLGTIAIDFTSVAFDADRGLVVGSSDGQITTWAFDGTQIGGFEAAAFALAPHPDRPVLAVLNDKLVQVWDSRSATCRAALRLGGKVNAIVWLGSGTGLAVAGDGGVYVLDLLGTPEPDLDSDP
jgi:WD40 repeat protein